MKSVTLETALIKRISSEFGFEECRVVKAEAAKGFNRLVHWLDRGYGGSMHYIDNRLDAYRHPSGVFPGTRSIMMLVSSYRHDDLNKPHLQGHGQVARYAAGDVDYHDILHDRMKSFIGELRSRVEGASFRGVVDSAPILEREFAQQAGLGWIGKNTMLISRKWGSYFFLSAILTNLELEADPPFEADHCGSCRACLDACPTNAFVEPHVLDAKRCISYLTIENREVAPSELRAGIGDWIFGCDICQEVCPWNRKAKSSASSTFAPKIELRWMDLDRIMEMNEISFRKEFRHTPFWRAKLVGLQRNALISMANQRLDSAINWAYRLINHEHENLRIVSAWVLGQLGNASHLETLRVRQRVECNIGVQEELQEAIMLANERLGQS